MTKPAVKKRSRAHSRESKIPSTGWRLTHCSDNTGIRVTRSVAIYSGRWGYDLILPSSSLSPKELAKPLTRKRVECAGIRIALFIAALGIVNQPRTLITFTPQSLRSGRGLITRFPGNASFPQYFAGIQMVRVT